MTHLKKIKYFKNSGFKAIGDVNENINLTGYNDKLIFTLFDKKYKIANHATRWLSYLSESVIAETFSLNSLKQYATSTNKFSNWLENSGRYPHLSLDEMHTIFTRDDLRTWIQSMAENGLSPNTMRVGEVALKQFVDWLTTNEGGKVRDPDDSPYGRLNKSLLYISKKVSPNSPKFIDQTSIISILSNFHNECERCLFHTQYDTGLRITELINLRLGDLPDLNMYGEEFLFIPLVVKGLKNRGAGFKERISLISRPVLNRIRNYNNTVPYKLSPYWDMDDPQKPVFLSSSNKKWKYSNLNKQFNNATKRANLSDFVTHWMRHGTAFSVLRSDIGKDYVDKLLMVQKMLGHSHLSTTEIYTQMSPSMLSQLTKKAKQTNRLEEAENIRKSTYLSPLKHKEKRGHKS